ncbi:two-component system phosphate regulon sensor histidine kinase PhoR [Winogradskyella wandonensis]|uniref:histidine kinase n=1 Tax=Winogradskyella wandonensis TaxID=1442586 RepID=A0A4R1KIU2_9FLAO|nr:HAMP domain-containing sensor histidine kinase [Winogradskyella wandonensis]TCK64702.1 two-component system phosphate regulon sensor histidine kinase PhoR [Winogradskyella wandonensis]
MNKKLFVLLVVLMSLSLIGIIFVQSYFINRSLENERQQFSLSVKRALSFVSKQIEDYEYRNYRDKIQSYLYNNKEPDSSAVQRLVVAFEDDDNDQTIIHRNIILEERFKIPSLFFEIDADSTDFSKYTNERITEVYKKSSLDKGSFERVSQIREIDDMEDEAKSFLYRETFKDFISSVDYPLYKRISPELIKVFIEKNLKNEGIEIDFEYAIYDNDLSTKIRTENFEKSLNTYGVPVFLDNNNESSYDLLVDFPGRNKFLISTILWMIILSIIFTSVIIIAYSSAIYQLIKQRQISQIKTDFINNMTHEFKTPIATINLALDSIRNPKIIDDKEKVLRYLGMIKDENKRMHAQVENVLRISKLEKNELNISKERLKLHDLIEDAVTHVQLIIEDRKGYIKLHLNADKSSVLANETHFTNVIVNILDNAIKYSDGAPKIDVYTENVANNILLKISDKGNGMSKQVQKRVFEKFYREHTGNVHNVKGHGLGLAYVKQIVDDHQGYISVESEKGKGSTFTVRLPLIS